MPVRTETPFLENLMSYVDELCYFCQQHYDSIFMPILQIRKPSPGEVHYLAESTQLI